MLCAVILLHTLPDGSSHFDWLIDRGDCAIEHRLISFRCGVRVDSTALLSFDAHRMADHRARYLRYEGAVSGGRGVVRRVASGDVLGLEVAEDSLVTVINWGDWTIGYRGHVDEAGGADWRFVSWAVD